MNVRRASLIVLLCVVGAASAALSSASGAHKDALLSRVTKSTPDRADGVWAPATASAAALRRFTDPTGDSGTVADITNVDVGNDVVAGPIVIWVETPNRTALAGGEVMLVFLDTDNNGNTGEVRLGGAEYIISLNPVGLFRWDGANFAPTPAATLTAQFVASERATRMSINPSDLGGTTVMNFFLLSTNQAGDPFDVAPDGSAIWTYTLESGPVRLRATQFRLIPARPRANARFAAAMTVVREDLGEALDEGAITCTLRVGGRAVRATSRGFVGPAATCAWRLPRTSKGKNAVGSIRVTFGGTSVTRPIRFRVR